MKKLLKKLRDLLDRYNLLPIFSEDAVFLIAVSILSVCYINPEAFQELSDLLRNSTKALVIVLAGLGFTFYTAFFTRFKTETQKHYMLWFALIINFIIGVTSFSILKPDDAWFHYIFPVINIAAFIVVIILTYTGLYNTSRIATKSSEYSNLLYGTVAVILISWLYEHFFHTPWQITLSVSSAYAGIFNASVARYLPRIFSDRNDKTAIIHRLIDKVTKEMLEGLNSGKFDMSKYVLVTDSTVEYVPMPDVQDEDAFITQLRLNRDRAENLAVVSFGTYEWTRAWWSSTDTYLTLIIKIYLSEEDKRYEFYQTLEADDDDRYTLNDRGLIYQGRF
jgi:hypothetical protein